MFPTVPFSEIKTHFHDGEGVTEEQLGRAFVACAFREGEVLTSERIMKALEAVRAVRDVT